MSKEFNIKMTEDQTGCDNGFVIKKYNKGETYIVGESLFNSFKNMGACELVEDKKPVKKAVKKANPVKENKTIEVVEEVK